MFSEVSTEDDCGFTDDETTEVSLEEDVQQPDQDLGSVSSERAGSTISGRSDSYGT